jgi:tetratricopeptide (TPR) repeat protein/WD40 repeat protein
VRFTEMKLRAALLHLQEKEVLTQELSFTIALLQEWLESNRPIDRVREELVEVNPILTRYIELGQTFRDQNQREKALASYKQALEADPQNLQAITSSGYIHLELNDPASALKEFEEAVRIDPEDNNARTGLCQTLIVLGDGAVVNKPDSQAIQYYERVFEIFPDHLEARQHLARLLDRMAGEKHTAKEYLEARQLAERAATLDPDDLQIQEHKNTIVQEQDSRFLKGLTAQANRAIARRDWEKALELMEECNLRVPDQAYVQEQIEKIRMFRREQRRTDFKKRLDQLLDNRDWEKARAIPPEYIILEPGDENTAPEWMKQINHREEIESTYQGARQAVASKDHHQALSQLQELNQKRKGYRNAGVLILWMRLRLWFGRIYARHIKKTIPAVAFLSLGLIVGLFLIPGLSHKPPTINIPKISTGNSPSTAEADVHPSLEVITSDNVDRLQVIGEMGNHEITRVIPSPNGKYLVLVRPQTVDLFDPKQFTWIRSIPAPDVTQVFLYAEDSRMITLDVAGKISTWNTATAEMIKTFSTYQDYPFASVITPDGSRLAIPNQAAQRIDVWDIVTGEKYTELNAEFARDPGLAISDDGTSLAMIDNYYAYVWDLRNPEIGPMALVVDIEPPAGDLNSYSYVGGGSGTILALAFQPKTKIITIVTERKVFRWDLPGKRLIGEVALESPPSTFAAIAFTKDGSVITLFHGITYYRFVTESLAISLSKNWFGGRDSAGIKIDYVNFGSKGNLYVMKGLERSPVLFEIETYGRGNVYSHYGSDIGNLDWCEEVAFSPDSKHISARCTVALSVYSDLNLVAQYLDGYFRTSEWIDDHRLGVVNDDQVHIYYPFLGLDEVVDQDNSVWGFTMLDENTAALHYEESFLLFSSYHISISQNGRLLAHLANIPEYPEIRSVRGASFLIVEKDDTLRVIRINGSKLINHHQCTIPETNYGNVRYVLSPHFSIAVVSGDRVDLFTSQCEWLRDIDPYPATRVNAFHPNGDLLFGIGQEGDQWMLFMANLENNSISKFPLDLNFDAEDEPVSMAVSPDGKQIAILSKMGHLWIMGVNKK